MNDPDIDPTSKKYTSAIFNKYDSGLWSFKNDLYGYKLDGTPDYKYEQYCKKLGESLGGKDAVSKILDDIDEVNYSCQKALREVTNEALEKMESLIW